MDSRDDEKFPAIPDTLPEPASFAAKSWDGIEKDTGHDRQPRSIEAERPVSSHSTLTDVRHSADSARAELQRVETPKRDPIPVPKAARRGLFARFAVVAEVTEPVDYSNPLKWFITFIVAFAAAAAPVGSGIIFPALSQVTRELHTTETITNLNVALFMLSMAIFPLWWSAFSESFGRRTIYLTSFAMFVLFAALAAVSKTIGTLIVFRMLSGGAAASVQAVGAGTIADIWESRERGRAMGIFYLGPLTGPLLAPIIGGLLAQRWGWRATMWCLSIYGLITWIFILFALPETLKIRKDIAQEAVEEAATSVGPGRPPLSRTLTREKVQHVSTRWIKIVRMFLLDPLKIILYLRFPAVALTVYYASVTFGSLYVLNVSIQYTFQRPPYNYSTIVIGLLYLPNSVGYILASMFGGRWMDRIMNREAVRANRYAEDGKLIFQPEDRMRENAWLGALLYPAALIWYGWTAEKGVFIVAPMIANFFYGVGSMLIFAMATTMLTEFMPKKSSSGVAVNNLIRNIFSCVGGVVGVPLLTSIGNGWLFTILGLWAFSSSLVIWAMRRFGPAWRLRMEKDMD